MSGEPEPQRCVICDRAECAGAVGPDANFDQEQVVDCMVHHVNWRERCFAAEERLDYAKRMLHAIAKVARCLPVTEQERDAALTILHPMIDLLQDVSRSASIGGITGEAVDRVNDFLRVLTEVSS